jgi:YHS domain-containing protein
MSKRRSNRTSNRDPVCGQRVNRNKAHIVLEYKGREYPLCCPVCQSEFEKEPDKYVRASA